MLTPRPCRLNCSCHASALTARQRLEPHTDETVCEIWHTTRRCEERKMISRERDRGDIDTRYRLGGLGILGRGVSRLLHVLAGKDREDDLSDQSQADIDVLQQIRCVAVTDSGQA